MFEMRRQGAVFCNHICKTEQLLVIRYAETKMDRTRIHRNQYESVIKCRDAHMMNIWIVSGKTPAHRNAPGIRSTVNGRNNSYTNAGANLAGTPRISTTLAGGGDDHQLPTLRKHPAHVRSGS